MGILINILYKPDTTFQKHVSQDPLKQENTLSISSLFTIIINAAIFIVTKMVMKKIGSNLFNMTEEPQAPKRRMRGPDVNL